MKFTAMKTPANAIEKKLADDVADIEEIARSGSDEAKAVARKWLEVYKQIVNV